jgi:putative hydrolase of the HAD superfamily
LSFETWVFDLDNTLYPASSSLFPQIHKRMGLYIAQALKVDAATADALQRKYYREHGTTLRGLMLTHQIQPDEFLSFVHEIDCTVLPATPDLDAALGRIPGRKLVFTNGSQKHAENVLGQMGLTHHFDGIFDIKAGDYIPKPAIETYHKMIDRFGFDPKGSVMFEDLAHNLDAAKQLGMTTVWVKEEGHSFAEGPDPEDVSYIDHVTNDLAGWIANWLDNHPPTG